MGDNKRKRGRKPKNPAPETLDFTTTTATAAAATSSAAPNATASPSAMDDVFSVGNVELIDTTASPHHRRRRGRPKKKLPNHSDRAGRRPPVDANGAVEVVAPAAEAMEMEEDPVWESVVPGRVVPAMDAVVKVFCVHTEPNFSLPWQRKRQYSTSSSGFVIGGKRLLTNAHSVEHYTQVKLKKRGSDTKYLATVLAMGTECDIGNWIPRSWLMPFVGFILELLSKTLLLLLVFLDCGTCVAC